MGLSVAAHLYHEVLLNSRLTCARLQPERCLETNEVYNDISFWGSAELDCQVPAASDTSSWLASNPQA